MTELLPLLVYPFTLSFCGEIRKKILNIPTELADLEPCVVVKEWNLLPSGMLWVLECFTFDMALVLGFAKARLSLNP